MTLKAIHEKLEDIPEQYRELYSERDGKYELTGIQGVKTQADVDRLQSALNKEREDHKTTKEKLAPWAELDHDEIMEKIDRIPELEAAAANKIDEEKLNEMADKRAQTRIAPLERENAQLNKSLEEKDGQISEFQSKDRTRKIHDAVRGVATELKVVGPAMDDVLMLADKVFDVTEEGGIVTKENVGVTPGTDPKTWLGEMQEKRPHWWPVSQGGGAQGSSSGAGGFTKNPWSAEHWSLTEQGKVVKEKGTEQASEMAKAAGVQIGATKPAQKQSS